MTNVQYTDFERINVIIAEKSMKNKSNNRDLPFYIENTHIIFGKIDPGLTLYLKINNRLVKELN